MPRFFDYGNGNFITPLSDNMAIGSDSDLLMKLADNFAMDMDLGDIHFICGWELDDED